MYDFLISKKRVKVSNNLLTLKRAGVGQYYALLVILLSNNIDGLDEILYEFVDDWQKYKKSTDVTKLLNEVLRFNNIIIAKEKSDVDVSDPEYLKEELQDSFLYQITEIAHWLNWDLDDILKLSHPQVQYLLHTIKKIRAEEYTDKINASAVNSEHYNNILGRKKVSL